MRPVRTFDPEHKCLILRQRGAEIGIWDLKLDCWHRKPFTQKTTEAYQALKDIREGKRTRALPTWATAFIIAAGTAIFWLQVG